MWPGNTADVGSLVPVVDRLRKRFSIQRVCVVADRGMISAETIAELEARGLCYILGVRERSDKLVRDLVLADPAPFIPLTIAKRGKEIDYEAKAVMLAGRRYIVCRNREEMKKDAAARAAILAALERQLKKGDKTLVGNKGYRRFLATPDDDHFVIDRAKAEEDAKFDGIFVLRTNADLSPLETMLCYKHLWMVERAFRTSKSLFATRPIFHKLDETIRGHVSCSFLALVLKKELEDRIATLGHASSWPNVLADLELVDGDRGRTGRQTLSAAHTATPRRKPRPARRRRRPRDSSPAGTAASLAAPNPFVPLSKTACESLRSSSSRRSVPSAVETFSGTPYALRFQKRSEGVLRSPIAIMGLLRGRKHAAGQAAAARRLIYLG